MKLPKKLKSQEKNSMGIKELGPLLKSIKFKSKKFSNLQKFLTNNLKEIKKRLAIKTSSGNNTW